MQFSRNSCFDELTKVLFGREINSNCCCSISKHQLSYSSAAGVHSSAFDSSKQKIFTYLFPTKLSDLSSKQSLQNRRLYGVLLITRNFVLLIRMDFLFLSHEIVCFNLSWLSLAFLALLLLLLLPSFLKVYYQTYGTNAKPV